MVKQTHFARNVISNWISVAIAMLIPFFLTPFIVHHLGKVVYGIWILIVSLVAYLNLLDFGLRGAIIRFVSKEIAQGHHRQALATISTALFMRIGIGACIVLIGYILSIFLVHIFPVPAYLLRTSQIVLIIAALNAGFGLVFGVFGALLCALSRFELTSLVAISQTLIRALGILILLKRGHGLLSLAAWDFFAAMIGNLLLLGLTLRAYSPLRRPLIYLDRDVAKSLFDYSVFVFLITIAAQIVLYTDNIVVGAIIGTSAVAFYSIGGSLVEYTRQIVSAVSTTFTPMASIFDATGREDQLRRLLIHGTRMTLCVSLAVSFSLFFRGSTFISLWIGKDFAIVSGTVLRILIVSQICAVANTTSGAIVYGMAKHRPVAIWGLCEAACNLGLSVLFAHLIGIYGVAWGTAIVALPINLLVWPLYISKIIRIPIGTYVLQGWLPPLIAGIPYAFACYFTDQKWHARNLAIFFLQIAAIMPIFLLSAALIFRKEFRWAYAKSFVFRKRTIGEAISQPSGSETPSFK